VKAASELTFCVVDAGLFQSVARRLAQDAKRVLYHCPTSEGFPTINKNIIGRGFPDIEKVDDIWAVKDEVDCWVFPDINMSALQMELESQGRHVWGSRRGDTLELNRQLFHKTLGKLKLEVPKFVVMEGMTKLREHLKDHEDKFIKISRYRGSLETFHWRNWDLDEGYLDVLACRFGPAKEIIPFLVFDAIDTPLEIGGDTYCIDGRWPRTMLHGIETKDKAYLGSVTPFADMPKQLTEIMEAFSPVLAKYRYRSQWSMEVRVLDGKAFFTDPTCRGGLPSTSSQLALWKNLAEIVWAGSQGELIEPEPAAKYSAECMIKGDGADDEWQVVEIPDELAASTNFSHCAMNGKQLWFPPDTHHGSDLGWLVATGNSIDEVIDRIHKLTDLLPEGLDADTDSIVDLLVELKEAQKEDIQFGDGHIPATETALNV
jgi:hypothetical protein